MRIRAVIGAWCVSIAAPCLAGYLEDGVRFHEHEEYAKAVSAFQRAAASGNVEARRRLGFMYYHGEGIAEDDKQAVALFQSAAEGGDVESASNLAKMYEFGMGVEQDDSRAAAWYRKAAEMGDAGSQFSASVMYYKGQGVPIDRVEAAKWWTLAMLKGGAFADSIRPSVVSAEAKLTTEELVEGRRRAGEWLETRSPGHR